MRSFIIMFALIGMIISCEDNEAVKPLGVEDTLQFDVQYTMNNQNYYFQPFAGNEVNRDSFTYDVLRGRGYYGDNSTYLIQHQISLLNNIQNAHLLISLRYKAEPTIPLEDLFDCEWEEPLAFKLLKIGDHDICQADHTECAYEFTNKGYFQLKFRDKDWNTFISEPLNEEEGHFFKINNVQKFQYFGGKDESFDFIIEGEFKVRMTNISTTESYIATGHFKMGFWNFFC